MDAKQFSQFMEQQNKHMADITKLLQQQWSTTLTEEKSTISTTPKVNTVTEIIKNFKCDKYNTNMEPQSFIDYFEARCRMWNVNQDDDQHKKIKKELFLSCLSPESYHQLKIAFSDSRNALEEQPYESIIHMFLRQYQTRITRYTALSNFLNCVRKEGQSFESYANTLKKWSNHCGYKGEILDRLLRDRLATGVNHKALEIELRQRWPDLMTTEGETEREVTFTEILAVAQARETAEQDQDTAVTTAYHVQKSKSKSNTKIREITRDQCLRCGTEHTNQQCKAKKHKCESCGTIGHYGSCCLKKGKAILGNRRTRKQRNANNVHKVQHNTKFKDNNSDNETLTQTGIFHVQGRNKRIDVHINGIACTMDWDPGAAHSVISTKFWKRINKPTLTTAPQLRSYGNFKIIPRGKTYVNVTVANKTKRAPVIVVDKAEPMLFGLTWCETFGMKFPTQVYTLQTDYNTDTTSTEEKLKYIIDTNQELFTKELGTIKNFEVNLHIKDNAKPVHAPARPVNFGLQKNIENELQRLVKQGIIEPVDPNISPIEWATPTVNVPKANGIIRICGDFRTTINPNLIKETHPVPLFDQLRRQLAGGEKYSKIDLKDAYLQFKVAQNSKKYLVISTHKGYFRYNRLPFGISTAPAIFQRYMEKLMEGIPSIAIYFDDIAITGQNDDEHLRNIAKVFQRLREAGFSVRRDKCTFLQPHIEYLGHIICKEGCKPSYNKTKAIKNATPPTNKTELRSFLGFINFYEKFIPHLHGKCADLYELTKKNITFKWTHREQTCFDNVKKLLLHNTRLLVPFDEHKDIFVACDASEKGVGAVLFHRNDRGHELPITFASRKLTEAEQKYSVIDREALSIFFAVRKFDHYIRGIHFHLITDHKPLIHLFGEKRNLPKIVNNRITRWALYIGQYNYSICHQKGTKNIIADCLSRLPNKKEERDEDEFRLAYLSYEQATEKYNDLQLTKDTLSYHTARDKILKQVAWHIKTKWFTRSLKDELKPYYDKREEMSAENKILTWQGRIIIPEILKRTVLHKLHEGHPGIVAMKALARYYVWWPQIDKEIEHFCQTCRSCQKNRQAQPELPVYSWSIPERVWERLHIDYAGPFEGHMWLIIVDALSKWTEVRMVKNMTAETLCKMIQEIFTTFGYPKVIVTDNGTQFTSEKFRAFCTGTNIKHIRTTPYHPRSNGLAERFVRTFKEHMNASSEPDLKERLQRFLFTYRITPHSTTKKTPAEIMFGRRLNTVFDNLRSDYRSSLQLENLHKDIDGGQGREFSQGEFVMQKTSQDKFWTPATIKERTGRYSYRIITPGGTERRRHTDQLRKGRIDPEQREEEVPYIEQKIQPSHPEQEITTTESEESEQRPTEPDTQKTGQRRSSRERHLPKRYKDFILTKLG